MMKTSESLRDRLFDADTVRDLGQGLGDSNDDVRHNSIHFFITAIAHGMSFHFHCRTILIFVEDFRDKIFHREIVTTRGRVLGDINSDIRRSVVKIITAAIDQGALYHFQWMFILKYRQRAFETRYLTPRSSLRLNVH
jgi:hypothetical protein